MYNAGYGANLCAHRASQTVHPDFHSILKKFTFTNFDIYLESSTFPYIQQNPLMSDPSLRSPQLLLQASNALSHGCPQGGQGALAPLQNKNKVKNNTFF